MLNISLLGNFSIRRNDTPVTGIVAPRLQSLMAYLLLQRDAPQSRAHLAFLFWPDTSEAQARTNLRNLLHHLRQVLPDADNYIDTTIQTLQWRSDSSYSLDVADFEALLSRSYHLPHGSDPSALRVVLEELSTLYKGDLLPNCYDDWIIPIREGLRQAYLDSLEHLVCFLEEQRDYKAALTCAQQLLRTDPIHEATYRHLIRLFALNGDRAAALRAYHTCTTVLRRELDVEPAASTRRIYEQLLGDETIPSTFLAKTAFSPLVGREREWVRILQDWRKVSAGGGPQVLMLNGEAGIGKTRLAEELLQWAARQGIATAASRCYAAEGELAFAPVIAWLRARPLAPLEDDWLIELGRLIPELLARRPDLPHPAVLTDAWQRQRVFEALSRALLGANQPLILMVDDLQWCDRDTLEFLHFLIRFDHDAQFLVVGAYRTEEIDEGHPLQSWLQAVRPDGQLTEIDLGPLDEKDTCSLAMRIAGEEISPEYSRRLYRETEGNPLFVVETIRAGLEQPDPNLVPILRQSHALEILPDQVNLPPKVLSVLQARLAQVSLPARELAGLASAIGREFSFKLLVMASNCDEDIIVRELDELWRRRIIREHGADTYDFSHDKLREVAYKGLSTARRRLLHRHIAQALQLLHNADLDPVSHQLAAHYENAGLMSEAVPFYLRAAGVARQVFANEDAIALLKHGLALVEIVSSFTNEMETSRELAAQLWEALGDILELRAQHEEALHAYFEARSLTLKGDMITHARLMRKEAAVKREQRLYAEALDICLAAEKMLNVTPDQNPNPWWDEWLEVQVAKVWVHYWLAQWPEMETLVKKLREVEHHHKRADSHIRILWASCLFQLRKDHYVVSDEMLADARKGLALSQQLGNLKTRIEWNFELGFLHLWRHETIQAEPYLKTALELTETSGIMPMQVLSLTYLSVLNRFRGNVNEVQYYTKRTQEAAISAMMPDYLAAANGNQAWLAWRRQDLSAVEEFGREAISIWRQSPLVYPFQWQAIWPLIAVSLAQGCEDEAWAYVRKLLEPTQQLLPEALNAALISALQAKSDEEAVESLSLLQHAVEIASEIGYL